MEHGNCMTCAYFEHDDDYGPDKGTCRRQPPFTAYDVDSGEGVSFWALVDFLDWCGEYREQEP